MKTSILIIGLLVQGCAVGEVVPNQPMKSNLVVGAPVPVEPNDPGGVDSLNPTTFTPDNPDWACTAFPGSGVDPSSACLETYHNGIVINTLAKGGGLIDLGEKCGGGGGCSTCGGRIWSLVPKGVTFETFTCENANVGAGQDSKPGYYAKYYTPELLGDMFLIERRFMVCNGVTIYNVLSCP